MKVPVRSTVSPSGISGGGKRAFWASTRRCKRDFISGLSSVKCNPTTSSLTRITTEGSVMGGLRPSKQTRTACPSTASGR